MNFEKIIATVGIAALAVVGVVGLSCEPENYVEAKSFAETQIEIGGKETDEFESKMVISKWDDEVNFSIQHKNDESNFKLKTEDGKIKLRGEKIETHFYKDGENYEFEIILLEKPATNIVSFDIETKGLKFFYQPELSQKEKDAGKFRPENVVGSYAVFHEKKKGDFSAIGGKNYRAGKVFHIFRPRIVDSAGNEVWGKLNISQNLLTVEIPQKFLDDAIYPIQHAAGLTFGVAAGSPGGSYWEAIGDKMVGTLFTSPSNIATATELVFYAKTQSSGKNGKGVLVLHSNLNIISDGVGGAVSLPTTAAWTTSTFGTPPTVSQSTEYVLMWINDADAGNKAYYYYDAGDANQGHWDDSNNYGTPTNPTDATHYAEKYSVYCTYTADKVEDALFFGVNF